jgi:hypothetical protein
MKLEAEQSKKWVADEDVLNCTKCNTAFGWTVRRVCDFSFSFLIEIPFSYSIIVDIVKRFFVIIVRIIGYKVKNQSMLKTMIPKMMFFSLCFSSPQYRICDYCNEKSSKEPVMRSEMTQSVVFNNNQGTGDDADLRFEVRPERLSGTTDT